MKDFTKNIKNELSLEEGLIEANNIKIFYRKIGNGPPLLLLHGYPQTHFMWHKVEPYFYETLYSDFY